MQENGWEGDKEVDAAASLAAAGIAGKASRPGVNTSYKQPASRGHIPEKNVYEQSEHGCKGAYAVFHAGACYPA